MKAKPAISKTVALREIASIERDFVEGKIQNTVSIKFWRGVLKSLRATVAEWDAYNRDLRRCHRPSTRRHITSLRTAR